MPGGKAATVAGFALAACALRPGTAHAADLVVEAGKTFSISGDQLFGKVVIEGTLKVSDHDASDATSGWVRLRAASIVVAKTGLIDAHGHGYRGTATGGRGHPGGAGGSVMPLMAGAPTAGGGGAHVGPGGSGLLAGCLALLGAEGGAAYDDAAMPLLELGLGSAGGASYAGGLNPMHVGAGAHGGGVVLLEAATISGEGTLDASGNDAMAALGSSPGGGAGGTVFVRSNAFTFGDAALVLAKGGVGAKGNAIGGSGGGGVVVFEVFPAIAPDAISRIDILGGAAIEAACTTGKGGDGSYFATVPAACVDADRDGHGSADCAGGDDCDDVDAGVNAGAAELCNGRDDDCSGAADDATALCAPGQSCEAGVCVDVDMTTGQGGGVSGIPEVELRGGLCTVSGAHSISGASWVSRASWASRARSAGGVTLAVTLALCVACRRRARSGRRTSA